jgi:DNA-binding response OmpR family regulator
MATLRVLILEDEPIIAMDLESTISEDEPAAFTVTRSVAGTEEVLHERFDIVFLDIDTADGRVFDIAHELSQRNVPLVFMSGFSKLKVPAPLLGVPCIPKPFRPAQIERALRAAKVLDR